MTKVEELKKSSKFATKFMMPNMDEDANTRWVNKKVYDTITLYDGTSLEGLSYNEDLKVEIDDYTKDAKTPEEKITKTKQFLSRNRTR